MVSCAVGWRECERHGRTATRRVVCRVRTQNQLIRRILSRRSEKNSIRSASSFEGQPRRFTANSLPGLVYATNSSGVSNGVTATDATHTLGPFIQGGALPPNPYDGKNTISQSAVFPPAATTANGGWLYKPTSGQIAVNHSNRTA
jgi:hypothetical protein